MHPDPAACLDLEPDLDPAVPDLDLDRHQAAACQAQQFRVARKKTNGAPREGSARRPIEPAAAPAATSAPPNAA